MQITSFAFALASLLPLTFAQSNYPNQSAPFNLILTSTNETLNNASLTACHSGAAIESLCIDTSGDESSEFEQFYYNTTTNTIPISGILTWNLVGGNFVDNEAMVFQYNPTSNLAQPLLFPDPNQAQQIIFDNSTGEMGIPLTVVDTTAPPYAVDPTQPGGYPAVYRWYVCQTYVESYTYYTLTWKLGNEAEPQNPSCQSVSVRRVFTTPTYPSKRDDA